MTANISFEQDAQLIGLMLTLLKREQEDLVHANIGSIESLMDEKSEILQAINLSTNVRYDALRNLGLPANEEGMEIWVKQQNKPSLTQAWQAFQHTVGQAKEMNRLNGTLINKHFARNQQLLSQLQGNYAKGGVYGANGQATARAYSRAALLA